MVLPDTVKVYFSPLQGHHFKISVITRKAFLKAISSTSAQLIGYYMDHVSLIFEMESLFVTLAA